MNFAWHDVVGGLGAGVLLVTYFLLQANLLSAKTLVYSLLNALGAAGILVSLTQAFNLAAFVVESAWLLISLFGAAVTLRDRRKAGA